MPFTAKKPELGVIDAANARGRIDIIRLRLTSDDGKVIHQWSLQGGTILYHVVTTGSVELAGEPNDGISNAH